MLFHRKTPKEYFDRTVKKPVIRSSICTGERVAGFRDLATGRFEEIMFLADDGDLADFMERYDISEEELSREW